MVRDTELRRKNSNIKGIKFSVTMEVGSVYLKVFVPHKVMCHLQWMLTAGSPDEILD